MTILTLALTTIFFSSPASPEPAAKGPDTWTPLSFTVFNECTGESVLVSGNAHIVTRTWTEGSRVFIRGHINMNLSGVGLISGKGYRLQQNSHSESITDVTTGASGTDQVYHLSLVSQGRMPNARVTMNGTVILDPSGNSTVIPKQWVSICK